MKTSSIHSPFVSIVLPTHNRCGIVERSIRSVLHQTFTDFELIVVDDASTDETASVVNHIGDPRLIYVQHNSQRGANVARNTGILLAKGKYIAFQDSDDEWLPEKLSAQFDAIERAAARASVIFCRFWRMLKEKSDIIPKPNRISGDGLFDVHADLLLGNFITTQTLVVEKQLLMAVGKFDESLRRLQDWDLVLRLSAKCPFLFVDQPLVRAFIGDDSISSQKKLYRKAVEAILKKHHRAFSDNPVALPIQYMNLGIHSLTERDARCAVDYFIRALKEMTSRRVYKSILIRWILARVGVGSYPQALIRRYPGDMSGNCFS
jgi:glycosyltransferase involved in cell wall biosynthesis